MAVITLYRISEEIAKVINGGQIKASSNVNIGRVKIVVGQVINSLLKIEHFTINEKMGEKIPNGTVLGLYEDIEVFTWNGKSKCTLPIKPIKLPRNIGIWAIYPKYETNGNYELDKEYIPLQMGQGGLIKSQPLLNDLLGQVGYENFGNEVIFTKDVKSLFPNMVVAMRLAVMDISQYGDYDPLPILPEQEFEVKNQVIKFFEQETTPDMLVDATSAEQKGTPIVQQKQSS
jgi:hypothetical protein